MRSATVVLVVLATVLGSAQTISAQASSMADTLEIVEATIMTVGEGAQGLPVVIVPKNDSALTARVASRLGHSSQARSRVCDLRAVGRCGVPIRASNAPRLRGPTVDSGR